MRYVAILIGLAATLLLATEGASAGPASYKCVITNIYELKEAGVIADSGFYKLHGDRYGEFMVDRRNGSIVGDFVPNAVAKSVVVATQGSDGMSFRVVSTFNDGKVDLLEIREFVESRRKPFVILAFAGILTGTCE